MGRQLGYDAKKAKMARVAWDLFLKDGYDNTSVDRIIQAAETSKGTFYHYFSSKEALLDFAIDLLFGAAWEQVRAIADESESSAIVRLNRITAAALGWRSRNTADVWNLTQATFGDRNLLLRSRMNRRLVEAAAPALARILADGVTQFHFQIAYPQETAELILRLANAQKEANARDLLAEEDRDAVMAALGRRMDLFVEAVERILAAPTGCLERCDRTVLEALMDAKESAESSSVPRRAKRMVC